MCDEEGEGNMSWRLPELEVMWEVVPESRYQSEVLDGKVDDVEALWRAVCRGPMSHG